MYEKLLEECGLTQNETLVYLALLKMGKAKSGEIIREAKISGGKIYETLYKLVDKGLVKEVSENRVKRFIANDPKTLISYIREKGKSLKEKENELNKAVPLLFSLKKQESESDSVSLVKGTKGISPVVYSVLEQSKEIRIMGVRSSKKEEYNNFWRGWHRKRVELKREAKMLFSDRNTDYWRFFRKLKYTKVKELLHLSPSAIMTIDNNAFLFSYEEEFTCIHITSDSISSSLSNFFDDLWRIAKK
ncbi:MAG: helix-turn-helix domain-containing protein [Candidatus Nanoarchaeia archaeon]|nr:helix-turn-helix domain-containing protein [Candidatus Nanoarchaeia archaeon]MDD5740489.1 helix-turn-helix domain-containing protein [Candidatus Nanoarchaeia archaeon]